MFGTANKKSLMFIAILCLLVFLSSCGYQSDEGGPAAKDSDGNGGVSAEGLVLSTALQITTAANDQGQPAVAYDDLNNQYLVVYASSQNLQQTGIDIHGVLVNPDGTLVGGSEVIIANTTGNQTQPKVAYDVDNDKFLVVWTNVSDKHIYGQFLTNGSSPALNGSSFIVSQVNPSDYVYGNDTFDVGWAPISNITGEVVGTGDGSKQIFSIYLTNVPSAVPTTVLIKEDGVLVGTDNGYGLIEGSRSSTIVTGEAIGTGDGTTITFVKTVNNNAITSSSLNIKENNVLVASDDGAGKLIDQTVDQRIDTTNSSVNYATGQITLVYDGENDVVGELIGIGGTVGGVPIQSFNDTLSESPVKASSVFIYNGTDMVGYDDGSGGFVATQAYFNDVGSSINYTTGAITAAFINAPTGSSQIKADYTVKSKAPASGVALTADYVVPGFASNLFTNGSYIDYQTGSLHLEYSNGAAPGNGVQITVDYQKGGNWIDNKDVYGNRERYYYTSQQSPSVVYDVPNKVFLVSWLDNTNEDVDFFFRHGGNGLCTNNVTDGVVDYNDTSGDADIFSFKLVDLANKIDANMIRYREVTYSDSQDGDNDIVYDADDDGVKDTGDGSFLDSTVVSTSRFKKTVTNNVVSCSSTAESWTVDFDIDVENAEAWPAMSYSDLGAPIVAWMYRPLHVTQTYKWSRSRSGAYWGPWDYVVTGSYTESPNTLIKAYTQTPIEEKWLDLDIPAGAQHSHPHMAVDESRSAMLLAWESQEGGDKNIYGNLIDLTSFITYGNPINISTVQYDQSAPRVAFDPVNNRYMVVWEDARNTATNISNMDVYGQFIDPQGQLSGSNFPVTTNTSNQIAPALAFGDTDATRFLIAWKDGRNPGDADIYGQLWEYSVAPQLLITDDQDVPLYQQTIPFGGVLVNNEAFATFRIWNNGNAPLVVNSVTPGANVYLGTNSTYPFNIINPLPLGISNSISPGSYYEVTVRFLTNTASTYSGADNALDILTNGGSTILYFSGYGIGTNPQITTTSLPNATVNIPYLFTVLGSGGTTPYTWSATGLPGSLIINATSGVISGTPTLAEQSPTPYSVDVTLTDSSGKFTTVNFPLVVSNMAVTTTSLINAPVNIAYSQQLAAAGGSSPYTWTIINGALPPGLTMSPSGLISGTPTNLGLYNFTVQVADSASIPNTAVQDLSIEVTTALEITSPDTANLPDGSELAPYDVTLTAIGGPQNLYQWSVDPTFNFPPGLSLNPDTGRISGTPSAGSSGSYTVRIYVTDVNGVQATRVYGMNITDVVITTQTLANPVVNVAYSTQLTAEGGTPPYQWTWAADNILIGLPPGLSLNSSGLLSGTPTTKGVYPVTISAQDENGLGSTGSKSFIIIVTDISFTTTSPLPPATTNTDYIASIDITGGTASYNWALIGNIPTGLVINTSTPTTSTTIYGQPLHSGTYNFTVTVTDATSTQASQDFALTVNSDLLINTTSPLLAGMVNSPYIANITASGGVIPYTFALGAGTMAPGLTLGANGQLTGTPTKEGPYSFEVIVTDKDGEQFSKVFDLNIQPISTGGGGGNDSGGTTSNEACYIATAAYGSYLDPHVQALRNFRDHVLKKSVIGRELVGLYYRTSPPMAEFIRKHEAFRTVARITLTPVVYGVAYPGLGFAMIFGSGALGALWWRRRKFRPVREPEK